MSGTSYPAPLLGFRVLVNPMLNDVPRMRTSPRFAELMPVGFVDELNAWMLEFFGTEPIAITIDRNTIVVSEKTYRAMQEQL